MAEGHWRGGETKIYFEMTISVAKEHPNMETDVALFSSVAICLGPVLTLFALNCRSAKIKRANKFPNVKVLL